MNDFAELKKVKERSPTFPFITLERAIERARQFYDEERRGVAPFSRAVLHWEYSDSSSGALQTVAALKGYGLLDELGGSGKQRQLQLSQLALRILLDSRPDSPDVIRYIQQAALSPAVAAEVHQKWPGRLPNDSTINHYLVLERRFSEASSTSAIKILKENQAFAKLDGAELQSPNPENEESSMNGGAQLVEHRLPPAATPLHAASVASTDMMLRRDDVFATPNERELLRGPLSKGVSYRLLVNGDLGAKELSRLIRLLETHKSILEDDDIE